MIAIVAADEQWGIGRAGQLQHPISEDLKRFKALTLGKVIIYGRKTLATYPGQKPLPGRENFMLSRTSADQTCDRSLRTFASLEDLLAACEDEKKAGRKEEDFIVVGGASVYRLLLPYTNEVMLTRLEAKLSADAYFPNLDEEAFSLVEKSESRTDGELRYHFELWRREEAK